MTDYEAMYGEFKATKCEWIGVASERCSSPVLKDKCFCQEHYNRVFKQQPLDSVELEIDENIAVDELLVDISD